MSQKLKRAERKITGHFYNGNPRLINGRKTVFCIHKNVWDTMWPFFKAKETRLCFHFNKKVCSEKGCPQKVAHDKYMALKEKNEMNWFDYVKKNSPLQIVRDYREYRSLRCQLRQAKTDLLSSGHSLVREYDIEDDINIGDACLKHKKIIESDNLFDDSACCFTTSRCLFFEPVGDEGVCPNTKCAYWKRNNQYHQNLCQVKELKQKIDNFWADKYANVK